MSEPKETQEKVWRENVVVVNRPDVKPDKKENDDEDEITVAKSIFDEIVEESENDESV